MVSIEEVLQEIKKKIDSEKKPDKVKVALLFACNTSGKTRLSKMFADRYGKQVLCYNAFLEDYFSWDNENIALKLNPNSWIAQLIKDEGLERRVSDNFKKLTNSKIEPEFDLEQGKITFGNHTGDENTIDSIKISRGEESLFVWSIFYTILDVAVDILSEPLDDRSTHFFDNMKYIVIDDPVSSMDDTRIITVALELIEIVKRIARLQNKLRVILTTHHALFYNVLYSEKVSEWYKQPYLLTKSSNNVFSLSEQKSDSPFAYHNLIFSELQNVIQSNDIQKYHFNLFRALLEKTANFLGYSKWSDLLDEGESKNIVVKQLNLYSHSSLSEIEASPLMDEEKEAFKQTFEDFATKFHWRIKRDESV